MFIRVECHKRTTKEDSSCWNVQNKDGAAELKSEVIDQAGKTQNLTLELVYLEDKAENQHARSIQDPIIITEFIVHV